MNLKGKQKKLIDILKPCVRTEISSDQSLKVH